MPTTYEECPREVPAMARTIIEAFHPDLIEAGVTIAYFFATNEKGPALKLHGYQCDAIVKINSYKNRVGGLADCSITIDEQAWDEKTEDERNYVLAHELHHLIVKKDKAGHIVTDGCSRPKLLMRPHDVVVGDFHVLAKRYGMAATGVRAVFEAQSVWVQMGLDFGKDGDDRQPPARRVTPEPMKEAVA